MVVRYLLDWLLATTFKQKLYSICSIIIDKCLVVLGNLYCEIQNTFLTEIINPLIYIYMSYKRNVPRTSYARSVSLATIDTKLVTSIDGETTITDLDFSQQDSIHVDDMRISVLKENGMLGNLKPFSPVFDNLSVNDAISGAQSYIDFLTQKKQELEDLAKAEELDN